MDSARIRIPLAGLALLFALPAAAAEPGMLVSESQARAACIAELPDPLLDTRCKVEDFGGIGTLRGHAFAYALYTYATTAGAVMAARSVVFERLDAGRLRVLFAPVNEGGGFDTPKLIRTPARIFLQIPGSESGTGNFNRERLYVWRNEQWNAVDTTSWRDSLQRRLPKGLGAWKGIYPDYVTLRASTPLWRDGDSNASPTGGRARLRFAWRGDRIILTSVVVHRW